MAPKKFCEIHCAFFHSFCRSIIITSSNTYGETAAYDRKRSESTYSGTSGGKIPEEEFIDSQVVTSQHSKNSSNCPQIQNQKRSTVAAIKVRFFAEKPHVEIEVNDNSPTL